MFNSLNIKDSIRRIKHDKKASLESNRSSLKLPPIQQSVNDEIAWEVKALPTDWEPNMKPSKVVSKFLKEKEEKHEKLIQDMRDELAHVNSVVKKNMEFECNLLKEKFLETEKTIREELDKYTTRPKCTPIIDISTIQQTLLDQIQNCISNDLNKIEALKKYLQDLEKKRSDEFKTILKDFYAKMHELSYKVPHELQDFFEKEILNMNKITLNNHRCFDEVTLQLKLKIENDERKWIYEAEKLCDYFREIYKTPEQKENIFFDHTTDTVIDMEYINEHSKEIARMLISFDVKIKSVKAVLEQTIEKLFNGRYDDIHNAVYVDDAFLRSEYHEEQLYAPVCETFYEDKILKKINKHTMEIMYHWKTLLNDIREQLVSTKDILKATLKLWDPFYERLFELNCITIIDYNLFVEKNAGTELTEICKINTLIDKIRMSSNEDEMKYLLNDLKKYYENIKKNVLKNTEAEKCFFDKFKSFAKMSTQILIEELKEFLCSHSKPSDVDPTLQRGRGSQIQITPNTKPKILIEFSQLIQLLQNWIYGLHETVKVAMNHTEIHMEYYTKEFVENHYRLIDAKNALKLELYAPKIQRVYENIYKVRLAELKEHKQRLLRHIEGCYDEINQIQKINCDLQSKYQEVIKSYEEELEGIKKRIAKTNHSSDVTIIISQIEISKQKHQIEFAQIYNENMKIMDEKIKQIQYSSLQYLKHIKLFNEDGNYNEEESNYYRNELILFSKNIKKDIENVYKDYVTTYNNMLNELNGLGDQVIKSMTQRYCEFEFKETIDQIIKTVQNNIKEETYKLKFKYKVIQTAVEQLKPLALKRMGMLDYLNDFTENCQCVEAAFIELRNMLIQKQPFSLNLNLFSSGEKGEATIEENLAECAANQSASKLNMVLFERIPEGDDYMSTIINILHKSLTSIQSFAKQLHARCFPADDAAEFRLDLKEFLIDVLGIFLYYQLQCEEIWLVVSIDCILLIYDVSDFITNYYEQSINTFMELKIKENKKRCDLFNEELKSAKCEIETKYQKIHDKLKPLHGHPYNKNLLEQLNLEMEEVNKFSEEQERTFKETFKKFQIEIQNDVKQFEEQIHIIELQLKTNLNRYTSIVIKDETFFNQIQNRIEYLQKIITTGEIVGETDIFFKLASELNEKIRKIKSGLKISKENLLQLSESFSLVFTNRAMYSKAILEATSSSNSSIESTYINVDELIERYKDMQESCIEHLDSIFDFEGVINKWKMFWNNDKERIFNLYTVKYSIEKSKQYMEKQLASANKLK